MIQKNNKGHRSENDIIKSILAGNKEDFKFLIEKYQDAVFRLCMGYIHDEDDANDITQESFINAYQNLGKFRFDSKFSTWLYRIAMNMSLNHIRSKRFKIFGRLDNLLDSFTGSSDFLISNFSNPEKLLIEKEHHQIVHKEIEKLSEKQKTVFTLSRYNNLSQKEIAGIMHISEGAVESLLQRAKANLQKGLLKYFKKK